MTHIVERPASAESPNASPSVPAADAFASAESAAAIAALDVTALDVAALDVTALDVAALDATAFNAASRSSAKCTITHARSAPERDDGFCVSVASRCSAMRTSASASVGIGS
ncbi:MAG: hypothetical protein AB7P00_40575, partial [Sandaracinaceae bacterium]